MNPIRKLFRYLIIDRPASKIPMAEFPARLETGGQDILQRLKTADATDQNRRQLRHIIGIERWGQRRLRVLLGEPLVMDEYDEYRPSHDQSWQELQQDFKETRNQTVYLAHQLEDDGIRPEVKVPHNQHGDFNVRQWLYYLLGHADMESKRIK